MISLRGWQINTAVAKISCTVLRLFTLLLDRRTEYEIDQQPLELAFCQYFDQKQPSVVFIIDRTLEAVIQEVQQDFLKSLHSRCLVCCCMKQVPKAKALQKHSPVSSAHTLVQRIFLAQMLRVRHLAMGKEMLLRSDKLGSNVYGYIETSGIIEALAQAEYQHFITSQPPQLVRYAH